MERAGKEIEISQTGVKLVAEVLAAVLYWNLTLMRSLETAEKLTHERPSANDCMAEASSIAKLRKENERLKAADILEVGFDMRSKVRVVNIRILSRC